MVNLTQHILEPINMQGYALLEMKGPDVGDFLHRLSTVHIKKTKEGTGSRGCFLSGVGKIQAFFWLWCLKNDHFLLEVDAGIDRSGLKGCLKFIDQYHFGEKMTFNEVPYFPKFGWISSEASKPCEMSILASNSLENPAYWIVHDTSDYGRLWATEWRPHQSVISNFDSHHDVQAILDLRIEHLSPRYPNEINDAVNPTEVHLALSIAEGKGCYPGQEVVERIWTYGSPPNRLVLLEGVGNENELLYTDDTKEHSIGRITTCGSTRALAMVKKQHAQPDTKIWGSTAYRILRVAPFKRE